jgi:hypothetical protein
MQEIYIYTLYTAMQEIYIYILQTQQQNLLLVSPQLSQEPNKTLENACELSESSKQIDDKNPYPSTKPKSTAPTTKSLLSYILVNNLNEPNKEN